MTKITSNSKTRRIISLLLTVVMLLSAVQINGISSAVKASGNGSNENIYTADPSTMDGWKQIFGKDVLSTQNAGAVWTDKSVFTDSTAFDGTGISMNGSENSFLVALSAIASNQSVTGLSNVPTDTVMVLDLSSSMHNGASRTPTTIQTMLTSVNNTITKLQSINKHNRVSVVIYFGGPDRNQSTSAHSKVMLPLSRYSGSTTYLKANVSSNKIQSIAVNSGLKNSAGNTVAQTTHSITDVAGTYAQLGLLDALNQFMNADTVIPANADYQPNVARVPILVFMSDGEPTAATHNYTQKSNAGMGNNTISIRNPNETDFVTQLTAAYVKRMVDEHYAATTPLFYSLSLGTSISMDVMDPANSTNATINKYWNSLITTGYTNISVTNSPNGWSAPSVKVNYTVERTVVPEGNKTVAFPNDISQKNYVDRAFTANDASQLGNIFESIVSQISLQSKYYPTLVETNENLDGYISFVDKIGKYMEVTDIKGILINNTLYSGANLASNFVSGGGDLGTIENPTILGDEMLSAVQARLGIKDKDTAITVLGLAYQYGQLSYTDKDNYSNYIGWYANAAGEYLGFWNKGTTVIPESTGNTATDPVYVIKSYGYLGVVDEEHGGSESDMMFAIVQVREEIATGEQTVVFAMPASLIPLVNYEIELDSDGNVSGFKVTGAEHPIRLVYEVALDSEINEITVNDSNIVDPEYAAANKDENGYVNFYTNQFEADKTVGYNAVNTYSYFRPSKQNTLYYFTESNALYTDKNGAAYIGTEAPDINGEFYSKRKIYTNFNNQPGIETVYEKLTSHALSVAYCDTADNSWHIPIGTVHVNFAGNNTLKTENKTNTLDFASQAFVDIEGYFVYDPTHVFVIGATLGNNGKVGIKATTGIALSKKVEGNNPDDTEFEFVITGSIADQGKTYSAKKINSENTVTDISVSFDANGKATVALKDGETVYITGMTPGLAYKIEEAETVNWIVASVNGDTEKKDITVILPDGDFTEVDFVNKERGTGSLTLTKIVEHTFGSDFVIPDDKTFDITVTLSGVGTADKTFNAIHSGDLETLAVTTDVNGKFTVTLGHNEQIQILDLPNGTVAAVAEVNVSKGFTPAYYENSVRGDGVVSINGVTSVVVTNTYQYEEINPANISVGGTKYYKMQDGSDAVWTNEEFSFTLQQHGDNGWFDIDTQTVSSQSPTFKFDTSSIRYSVPGIYSYRVFEVIPDDENKIEGLLYDRVLHSFSVRVGDSDMDGYLEIEEIYSEHTEKVFTEENGIWLIDVDFNNVQHTTVPAPVEIRYQKILNDLSGAASPKLSGYKLGIFSDAECTAAAVYGENGISKIETTHTDAVGEGVIDIIFDKIGNYTFYLKEINDGVKGVTYSQKTVKVDVAVEYGANGRLIATVSYTVVKDDSGNDGTGVTALNAEGEIEFTNIYDPEDTSLVIEANKTLIGRDMVKGEFEFAIIPNGSTETAATGTNTTAKDGVAAEIIFTALTFDKVGVYHYTVVETSENGNGITVDTAVHPIIVTVTDNGGQLVADFTVVDDADNDISFVNHYNAKPVQYTVSGTKTFVGRTLVNDEFTFVLSEVNADGSIPNGAAVYEAKNRSDGTFSFDTLEFTAPGTYYFKVYEKETSGALAVGVTFDKTEYFITVTVTDDGLGTLEASVTVDGDETKAVSFVNKYTPAPVSVKLHGNKILTGKDLQSGDYIFRIYASDENWNEGTLIEEVTNNETGHFDFTKLGTYNAETGKYEFTAAGTYYYTVNEVNRGEDIDGVLYDSTVYKVRIDITDNLSGHLAYEVTIVDQDENVHADLTFKNMYRVVTGTTVTIEGVKQLENLELKDGMFGFNLYKTDSAFENGTLFDTVKNENGKFTFTIEYTPEDINEKVFYYIIKEENAGNTINGITYSSATYNVMVTLTDNLDGTITAEVEVSGGDIVFINTYKTDSTYISIDGTKVLEGKELKENDFTFDLYEADKSFTVIGNAVQSVSNGADGKFVFEDITFDKADTYFFVVKENSSASLGGITYDTNEFYITVTVKDNGEGKLFIESKTVADKNGSADTIGFVNKYSTSDTSVSLGGTKVLKGKELTEGEFTFKLYQTDNNFAIGENALYSTSNNAAGEFEFTKIVFNTSGTYYYVIVEEAYESKTITFDTTEYCVEITVIDDGEGKLVASTPVIVAKGSGTETKDIIFRNAYTPETPETPPTSDRGSVIYWVILFASGSALVMTVISGKKKKETV